MSQPDLTKLAETIEIKPGEIVILMTASEARDFGIRLLELPNPTNKPVVIRFEGGRSAPEVSL